MKNQKLKETYNKIATAWFKDHKSDDWWVPVCEKLAAMLQPGASILDVGCGAGFKTAFFASRGFAMTAFDFSEEMVLIAKKNAPTAKISVLDLYDIDSMRDTFDCVFAQAVLLHIPRSEAYVMLEKMKNRLKSGGFLYVGVKAPNESRKLEEILTESDYGFTYDRFFSFYSQKEVEEYFKKLGFEISLSEISHPGKTQWVQVIGKLK